MLRVLNGAETACHVAQETEKLRQERQAVLDVLRRANAVRLPNGWDTIYTD